MVQYKKYIENNTTYYHVTGYLGVDAYGKQKNINKKGFETKKEAELYYSQAKLALDKGTYQPMQVNPTYGEVYEEWLEVFKLDVRESTQRHSKTVFNTHILPIFAHVKLNRINHRMIQRQLNSWHEEHSLYKEYYHRFKRVLVFAYKQGYLGSKPWERVSVPKKKKVKPYHKITKDYYTKDELEYFLEGVKKHGDQLWTTFFRLLAFTGVRKGEAMGLRWADINFKEHTLTINRTITKGIDGKQIIQTPKTKTSRRTIIIDPKTISVLQLWKKEQAKLLLGFGFNALNSDQYVFTRHQSNQLLRLEHPAERVKIYCSELNLEPIKVHGFRHTHCSLLFEAGVPIQDVQERLGHSDIQTTMNIYTHVTETSRNQSATKFANYVNF